VGKAGLEWVSEPAIQDGRVVYTYRNSGTATATVYETVNVVPKNAANEVQSFQLPGLEAGAEHTTHAPVSLDAPDGPVAVFVSAQATSGTDVWDAIIDFELQVELQGGVLVDDAANSDPAPVAPLALDVSDVRLDGQDLVLTYRFTGGGSGTLHASSFAMLQSQDVSRWNGGETLTADREDLARLSVPLDIVDSDGWTLESSLTGEVDGAYASARVTMQLSRADDGTVTDGGHSVETVI
jgi:hypothetical protein